MCVVREPRASTQMGRLSDGHQVWLFCADFLSIFSMSDTVWLEQVEVQVLSPPSQPLERTLEELQTFAGLGLAVFP